MSYRHPWGRRNTVWGYLCAIVILARATGYQVRPPKPDSLSSETIETIIGYDNWAAILFLASGAIVIGTSLCFARVAFVGHAIAVLCYLVFAYNLFVGAVRLDVTWVGITPLLLVAAVQAELVYRLGQLIQVETLTRQAKEKR